MCAKNCSVIIKEKKIHNELQYKLTQQALYKPERRRCVPEQVQCRSATVAESSESGLLMFNTHILQRFKYLSLCVKCEHCTDHAKAKHVFIHSIHNWLLDS